MGEVFRGEHWELSFGLEANYGVDPGTANLTIPFGVFERAQMADPEIEFTPFYGAGGVQARRYFRAYRGKWALEASVADVLLLDGKALVLPLGSVSTSEVDGVYTHAVSEETLLKSFTMHASFWKADDAGGSPTLMRRFLGGKIARATLSAEEGERLRIAFDTVQFKDIRHNIAAEANKYSATVAKPTVSYPSTGPFAFSGGIISIAGATFARIRSFRLDINNNCEAKYYIAGHDPAIPTPYTVLEGRREYGLTLTVDPEDTALYKEVLTMGLSGGVPVGIQVVLTMTRITGSDYIEISLPSGSVGIANQGCFIRRGRMDIDSGSPAVSQELDILTRSVSLEVKDGDAWAGW